MSERLGIAGAGTIGTGLAVTASTAGPVLLWARSEKSAERARALIDKGCGKLEGARPERIEIVRDLAALSPSTMLVEAVVEHHGSKASVIADLAALSREQSEGAILATTTSSLSIAELARASGRPESFLGLHVFNPVPRMQLVELVYPAEASSETRARSRALCETLGKVAVEVPDIPGFVVNRLLFPYLFSAVTLLEETGIEPEAVDQCMTLGAGMPMGPLALLDFVGLDVAQAIGDTIGVAVPERVRRLVQDGAIGRKCGRGFYAYE